MHSLSFKVLKSGGAAMQNLIKMKIGSTPQGLNEDIPKCISLVEEKLSGAFIWWWQFLNLLFTFSSFLYSLFFLSIYLWLNQHRILCCKRAKFIFLISWGDLILMHTSSSEKENKWKKIVKKCWLKCFIAMIEKSQ